MRLSECRLNGVFLATVHLSLSFTMLFFMAFMVGQITVTGFFSCSSPPHRREAKAGCRCNKLALPAVLVTMESSVGCARLMVVAVPLIPMVAQ